MERSAQPPELQTEIEFLSGVGARQLKAWRPTVHPLDSFPDAPALGVVLASSPQSAIGGERFVAKIIALAWPDPATDWLYQPGAKFSVSEGDAIIGLGCVLAVGGVSGNDA